MFECPSCEGRGSIIIPLDPPDDWNKPDPHHVRTEECKTCAGQGEVEQYCWYCGETDHVPVMSKDDGETCPLEICGVCKYVDCMCKDRDQAMAEDADEARMDCKET